MGTSSTHWQSIKSRSRTVWSFHWQTGVTSPSRKLREMQATCWPSYTNRCAY